MKNFYLQVDDAFLETIGSKSQMELQKIIEDYGHRTNLKRNKYDCYVRLCPYCNHFGILTCAKHPISEDDGAVEPYRCVFCGESTPYHKISDSIKKAQILNEIANYFSSDEKNRDLEKERALLEQCIIVLATGIELFFKDIYILSMDLKYVKPEYTLHSKFNNETKNDFLNIGKAVKKFKTEFEIDITEILGENVIKNLNILMQKRNVIVHNNGIIDSAFLNNTPKNEKIEYDIARPVPITKEEISEFVAIINLIIEKIDTEFDKIIVPELQDRIKTKYLPS